jgi:hypothetical protein
MEVDHPSLQYHLDALEDMRRERSETDQVDWSLPDVTIQRIKANDPFVHAEQRRRYDLRQERKRELDSMIYKAERSMRQNRKYLGTVYAASGYLGARRSGKYQDWALIKIREERDRGRRNKIPQERNPDWEGIFYKPEHRTIKGIAELTKGMHLFKVGHETGFRFGKLNGIEQVDVQSWMRNKAGGWVCGRGTAYLVVNTSQSYFGQAGDCGSFVFDGTGRFAGLYVAEQRELSTSYVTGARDLFHDMIYMTCAEDISLP